MIVFLSRGVMRPGTADIDCSGKSGRVDSKDDGKNTSTVDSGSGAFGNNISGSVDNKNMMKIAVT